MSTPFTIITNTNSVDLRFISDDVNNGLPGFLAVWTQFIVPTGCNNCVFPFTFGETTFDTCISVQDVDTQPWCQLSSPGEGPVANTVKIPCNDIDSSCPSAPSPMLITSPNYPSNYPNNANQVKVNLTKT